MSDNHSKLTIRNNTREKLERIATKRRWKLAEAVDALADEYIESHPDLESAQPALTGQAVPIHAPADRGGA